jgi:hypothetical protein
MLRFNISYVNSLKACEWFVCVEYFMTCVCIFWQSFSALNFTFAGRKSQSSSSNASANLYVARLTAKVCYDVLHRMNRFRREDSDGRSGEEAADVTEPNCIMEKCKMELAVNAGTAQVRKWHFLLPFVVFLLTLRCT